MDTSDWELLKVLREELSMTKTAEKLFISQPSLTYRLNKLETKLGVNIVERHSNGVSFTPEGEILVDYCRKMLAEYEKLRLDLHCCKERQTGTLSIGITTTWAKYYLPDILSLFKKENPGIRIEMITAHYYELMENFKKNKVDLLVIRGETDWHEKKFLIGRETYGFLTAKKFHFADIRKTPWIRQEIAGTRIQSGEFLKDWWKDHFQDLFAGEVMTVNSIETVVNLAAQGMGWAVLPEIHAKNRDDLQFHPMVKKDGSRFWRSSWALCKNESMKKDAVRKFVEKLLAII
ncbi:MAG: LysR family transcriptional regulator [Fusobacteriaceae bacterium]|jgi:DNA-binding transcriptional LysR family regulator|nr:LysR family transcriptional regulator [Fusobacteriaceae bacterium]